MLSNSEFALAASNDIKHATGTRHLSVSRVTNNSPFKNCAANHVSHFLVSSNHRQESKADSAGRLRAGHGKTRACEGVNFGCLHACLRLTGTSFLGSGNANLSLAVVFFTNRVIASTANHPVMVRTIEMAAERLNTKQKQARAARSDTLSKKAKVPTITLKAKKKGAFHITGPYVLNLALQEVKRLLSLFFLLRWLPACLQPCVCLQACVAAL